MQLAPTRSYAHAFVPVPPPIYIFQMGQNDPFFTKDPFVTTADLKTGLRVLAAWLDNPERAAWLERCLTVLYSAGPFEPEDVPIYGYPALPVHYGRRMVLGEGPLSAIAWLRLELQFGTPQSGVPCGFMLFWSRRQGPGYIRVDVESAERSPGLSSPLHNCQREVRHEILSNLNPYAVPRLLLSSDWLTEPGMARLHAQLIAIAAKKGAVLLVGESGNEAAHVFRGVIHQLGEKMTRHLSDSEKSQVADNVFMSLCLGVASRRRCFVPLAASSFEPYMRQCIKGEVKRLQPCSARPRKQRAAQSVPQTLQDAADALGLKHPSAVWKQLRKLGHRKLTPKAWKELRDKRSLKVTWSTVRKALERGGASYDTARKQVYRWQRAGKTPEEAARLVTNE